MQNPMSLLACFALIAGCATPPAAGNASAEAPAPQAPATKTEAPKASTPPPSSLASPPAQPVAKPDDKAWLGQMYVKVRNNLSLDPDTPKELRASFVVTQTRDGKIQSVKVKSASGYRPFDSAVEQAILKSSPLPKAPSDDVFKPEIVLYFRSSK